MLQTNASYLSYRYHSIQYPSPVSLNYGWNLGYLGLVNLSIQIATGILLAGVYIPHTELAFSSIEHILRDTNYGWLLRYAHANTASGLFIVIYCHILRGLHYGSYLKPRHNVWLAGSLILLCAIITAFLGYVLPWGQMSLWGATVITSLASAIPVIGHTVVAWLWGGFSVDQATLVRFYSIHYLMPFVLLGLTGIHIQQLHIAGSSNPLGITNSADSISLLPNYGSKDMIGLILYLTILGILIGYHSEVLGHADNSIEANALQTPLHIVPEWYFLPYYAILRSIPHKLLGVIAMLGSIIMIAILPWIQNRAIRNIQILPIQHALNSILVVTFCVLGIIGAKPVETPYIELGQVMSLYYFLHWLCFLPLLDQLQSKVLYHRG